MNLTLDLNLLPNYFKKESETCVVFTLWPHVDQWIHEHLIPVASTTVTY